jgi:dolichol-phosphate mannosyltransferase
MLSLEKSLVIIPTYNEIDNIHRMLTTLRSLYPELHILIIEDGSPDGTANVVKEFMQTDPRVHIIEREGKLGLGTAYITGFKWALGQNYDFICEMDCDFSHDPKDLIKLIEAAQKVDLAIGSRYINGIRIINWPMHRLLLSFFAGVYTRIVTGLKVLDATGGFKCFSRRALEAINLNSVFSNGYSFQIELNYKVWAKGMRIQEVPIVFTERRDGHSKMNQSIVVEAIFAVIKLRLKKIFGTID